MFLVKILIKSNILLSPKSTQYCDLNFLLIFPVSNHIVNVLWNTATTVWSIFPYFRLYPACFPRKVQLS